MSAQSQAKAQSRGRPARPSGQGLRDALRQFLTPWVWKQGHQRTRPLRKDARWTLQPLVLTLLAMTWCAGDSVDERFETGKAFCCVSLAKKRLPGRTRAGFEKALSRLPTAALRALAGGVRRRLQQVFGWTWQVGGFVPFGVDGSRLTCPRAAELEAHLPAAAKKGAAPTLWVTALVHLGLGLLWAWRLGPGTASERSHLVAMLPTLPAQALVVADAGFNGFFQAQAVLRAGGSFLIRMSAKVRLRTERQVDATRWRDGQAYYWPQEAEKAGELPLRVRLICLRGRKPQQDVWLLTNVLDQRQLPKRLAGQFYRWRWENEGLFRTYKRTLQKMKLLSRTLRLVHREAEASLLATQLLLAQGARAVSLPQQAKRKQEPAGCSARRVLLAIREELGDCRAARRRPDYETRLAEATRERRQRRSSKSSRQWPGRTPHKPPKAPQFLQFTAKQKARIIKLKQAKK